MRARAFVTERPVAAAADVARMAAEVGYYLRLTPRQLPSKYLYDELGSALFDAITCLPWYPLKRAEERLLRAHGAEIFGLVEPVGAIAELGPGRGDKLLTLFSAADRTHVAIDVKLIDVSASALAQATQALHAVTAARVTAYHDTYEKGLDRLSGEQRAAGRTLLLFLGSNIGNFDPPGAEAILRRIKAALGRTGALLLGTDLVKPVRDLLLAYDDPLGVTAAFNRNLLVRINRELDADFGVDTLAHRAIWNPDASRIEMHLVSGRRQRVRIRAAEFDFSLDEGEPIWTESSYKFVPDGVLALLERAGFHVIDQWIDARDKFALTLAEVGGSG